MLTVRRGVVQITPVFAAELLALPEGPHETPFRPEHVKELAAKMKAGRWLMPPPYVPHLDSEPAVVLIEVFDAASERWVHQVFGGRHRLHACVLAGAPFVTNFVWHEERLGSPLLGMYRR
jgi:hypothetical protein